VATIDLAIIVGTRPEAIKVWPVLVEARRRNLNVVLVSTNQQKHLLSETLQDIQIVPDFVCPIPNPSGDVSEFLAKAIVGLSELLRSINPRVVLVQGDTGTATAGAIAAHNLQIPIGHIESGLRSGDLRNPWPEEGNRRMIDSVASFLWRPSADPRLEIQQDQSELVVGNTSIDALRMCLEMDSKESDHPKPYILVTLHRRESFGKKMSSAIIEIKKLAELTKIEVVFVEHPNPKVREALDSAKIDSSNFRIINPVPYRRFIKLLSQSTLVISDSGGIQEEATALGIPLLVVRDKTERHEVVFNNSDVLVGSSAENLLANALRILENKKQDKSIPQIVDNSFGDGYAAEKIIEDLISKLFTNRVAK
jgi:UDP-N-acetylglucosamine 2-epimerase (non-hydrolysing)